MSIELTNLLQARYPEVVPEINNSRDKLLFVCSIDRKRCLNPSEYEEDYSLIESEDRILVLGIYTPYAENCADCPRWRV